MYLKHWIAMCFLWSQDIKGNDVDLSIYKGKVLLIVNVASQCGLTRTNYKELGELYSKYKESGKMAVCELMFHPGFPYQEMSVKGQRLGHYMQAQNWYQEC
jgi:glutathione peroxidase-family protein